MQSSKQKLRWVNDGWEPYTKRRASKLRRARTNTWTAKENREKEIRK